MVNNRKRRVPFKSAAPAEPHYFSNHLKRKLDQLHAFSATIVEAPSGNGKTTAVREYLDAAIDNKRHPGVSTSNRAKSGRLCRDKADQSPLRAKKIFHAFKPRVARNCFAAKDLPTLSRHNRPFFARLDVETPG